MAQPGRILVVDDLAKWREELVETLRNGGFDAQAACTTDEALRMIKDDLYHLLIVDIRMDEDNQKDEGGIKLLSDLKALGFATAIKVVMLTAYGTKPLMRTAFRDGEAVDFLDKDDFDNEQFLENVRQIFAEKIKINLSLAIHWQQMSGAKQAVHNLEVNGMRIKRDTSLQRQTAEELEDLLRRLFHTAKSIWIRPLSPGFSGAGVIKVQPFYTTGGGQTVVVKYGTVRKIEEEHQNFKMSVQPFVGGGRSTAVVDFCRTPRLGGIAYSLLGTSNDPIEDFGSFYRHADIAQIKEVLDQLFLVTCSGWYANPGQLQLHNLTEDYKQLLGFTPERLEQALLDMKSVQGKNKLYFKALKGDRGFTNPLTALETPEGQSLARPTYICVTHGDFNQHNILVDSANRTWLIDFQGTGRGHILRDVAMLDGEVRFKLLTAEEATLEERLAMEENLCKPDHFSQIDQLFNTAPTGNAPLDKAYAVTIHLRSLIRRLVPLNQLDDISEYHIALFYNAINTFRFYSLPTGQREHALLCASLLADRIGLKA